ncbi:tetratricopeptide repeat protein [Oligoflexus tunisiensis]|uniref:tetratricopeptide repeat protein n=1 Tax=Oligoflexus tunisiensis TaxID=708132 RepID=UPI00114CB894|nr:tetratricopeptide repeat protein [Oligoflexus tunisiensis]
MKALFVLILVLTGCQTLETTETPSRTPTDALRVSTVGQRLQLHRYDMQEIRRRYAGQNAFEQTMQALSEERWDLVVQQAEKHLKDHPGNVDAFLFLAIAYAAKGQIDRAQFYAELVLKGHPKHAMALNLMGVLQRQRAVLMEDYREAIAYFNLAHQVNPESLAPILNLGSINLEVGNFEAAHAEFNTAKKICDSCLAATLGAAAAAQALGRFQEAEADFLTVLDLNAEHPLANYLLAVQTFYVQGDVARSQKFLENVLEADGADADTRSQARVLMSRIEAKQLDIERKKADQEAH